MKAPKSNQNKCGIEHQMTLEFKEGLAMKLIAQVSEVKTLVSRALATQHPVKLVGILGLGGLLLAGTAVQFTPGGEDVPVNRNSSEEVQVAQDLTDVAIVDFPPDVEASGKTIDAITAPPHVNASLWTKPWTQPQAPLVVVERRVAVGPQNGSGINVQAHHTAQQELIELGFASEEEGQFQASIAEADDAGYGRLLLQAGFTEQQVRNAQERQREAREEAEADRWFQQLGSIIATSELRRHGFADYQGNVNVAAADDAGYGELLQRAGFTELQVQDAQRRQRQAHDEVTTEVWLQQAGEILGRGRVAH
jgi:hypothetical protein